MITSEPRYTSAGTQRSNAYRLQHLPAVREGVASVTLPRRQCHPTLTAVSPYPDSSDRGRVTPVSPRTIPIETIPIEQDSSEQNQSSARTLFDSDGPIEGNGKKAKANRTAEQEGFVEWYAAYPRHVARASAAKAYPAAIADLRDHDDPAAALMEATRAYAAAVAQWPEAERQYIPHPATWLRGARYRDDRATWIRQEVTRAYGRQLDNRSQVHPDDAYTF